MLINRLMLTKKARPLRSSYKGAAFISPLAQAGANGLRTPPKKAPKC
jgi:hypothetical protein